MNLNSVSNIVVAVKHSCYYPENFIGAVRTLLIIKVEGSASVIKGYEQLLEYANCSFSRVNIARSVER